MLIGHLGVIGSVPDRRGAVKLASLRVVAKPVIIDIIVTGSRQVKWTRIINSASGEICPDQPLLNWALR